MAFCALLKVEVTIRALATPWIVTLTVMRVIVGEIGINSNGPTRANPITRIRFPKSDMIVGYFKRSVI